MATNTNFKVKNGLNVNGQIVSSLAIGTSPLSVISTTLNTNLNADLLDGQHGSYYLDYNNFVNAPSDASIAYLDSLTQSSTTSTTLQNKVSLNFDLTETTTVQVVWGAQMAASAANRDMRCLTSLNGTTLAEHVNRYGTTSPAGGTFYFSGHSYRVSLAAGTHTVLLRYAATASGGTIYISKAYVEVYRI